MKEPKRLQLQKPFFLALYEFVEVFGTDPILETVMLTLKEMGSKDNEKIRESGVSTSGNENNLTQDQILCRQQR